METGRKFAKVLPKRPSRHRNAAKRKRYGLIIGISLARDQQDDGSESIMETVHKSEVVFIQQIRTIALERPPA